MINKISCNFSPRVSFGNKKTPETVNKKQSEDIKPNTDAAIMKDLLEQMDAIRNKIEHHLPVTHEEMKLYTDMNSRLNNDVIGTNLPRPISKK